MCIIHYISAEHSLVGEEHFCVELLVSEERVATLYTFDVINWLQSLDSLHMNGVQTIQLAPTQLDILQTSVEELLLNHFQYVVLQTDTSSSSFTSRMEECIMFSKILVTAGNLMHT
jgi:hypothetical protein